MDGRDYVSKLIDAFLAAEKTLQGKAAWLGDGNAERRVRWPLLVGDTVSDAYLQLTAYPNRADQKFTIALIYRVCVERVDWLPEYEWHDNPLDRADRLGGARLHGPHHHAWADNRHLATAAILPKELHCARLVPRQIRRWEQAFRWFCDGTRIGFEHDQMLDLPPRDKLL